MKLYHKDRASADWCDQWLLALLVETREASWFSSLNSLGKYLPTQIRSVYILFPDLFVYGRNQLALCQYLECDSSGESVWRGWDFADVKGK